jgi:hypothetical protein
VAATCATTSTMVQRKLSSTIICISILRRYYVGCMMYLPVPGTVRGNTKKIVIDTNSTVIRCGPKNRRT